MYACMHVHVPYVIHLYQAVCFNLQCINSFLIIQCIPFSVCICGMVSMLTSLVSSSVSPTEIVSTSAKNTGLSQ